MTTIIYNHEEKRVYSDTKITLLNNEIGNESVHETLLNLIKTSKPEESKIIKDYMRSQFYNKMTGLLDNVQNGKMFTPNGKTFHGEPVKLIAFAGLIEFVSRFEFAECDFTDVIDDISMILDQHKSAYVGVGVMELIIITEVNGKDVCNHVRIIAGDAQVTRDVQTSVMIGSGAAALHVEHLDDVIIDDDMDAIVGIEEHTGYKMNAELIKHISELDEMTGSEVVSVAL